METIGRPYKRDAARLEKALRDSILRKIAAVHDPSDYHGPRADEIASR